jgi:hypothetical protein
MPHNACEQQGPIPAVLASQNIDLSVSQECSLSAKNRKLLKDWIELFSVFVHPTKKLQASTYPTLNYAIIQYLVKNLEEKQSSWGHETLISVACTKSIKVLNKYFNYLGAYSHLAVAAICDPRFNVSVFDKVLKGLTNNAKKAKF